MVKDGVRLKPVLSFLEQIEYSGGGNIRIVNEGFQAELLRLALEPFNMRTENMQKDT